MPETAPQEHVFTILIERGNVVLYTHQEALSEGQQPYTGDNLQWPMQTYLAIVQEDTLVQVHRVVNSLTQSAGNEDGVGVNLGSPVMLLKLAVNEDLLPEIDKDLCVQSHVVGAPHLALQGAIDGPGVGAVVTRCEPDNATAVHSGLVTSEDADTVAQLTCYQVHLVAIRSHD